MGRALHPWTKVVAGWRLGVALLLRIAAGAWLAWMPAACSGADLPALEGEPVPALHDDAAVAEPAAPSLAWQPCPWPAAVPPPAGLPGRECAALRVPLDHADPDGRQIELAVARVRSARPERRRGVLLLQAGGPGSPGRANIALLAALLPRGVLDRYDLLGMDLRGTGASTPLPPCGPVPPAAVGPQPEPLDPKDTFEADAAAARNTAARCAAAAGDLLPFITTAQAARDIDRLREALGEPRLSYLGYGYGTYLGAVYASLFGHRADRVVLDSAFAPDGRWREADRAIGPAGEARFADFARHAAANHAQYQLGRSAPQIRQQLFLLADRLARHPVELPDGTRLDGTRLQRASLAALHADSRFPLLARLWQAARDPVPDTLRLQALLAELLGSAQPEAAVGGRWGGRWGDQAGLHAMPPGAEPPVAGDAMAAELALACGDGPWPRVPLQYRREQDLDRRLYPLFGALGARIHPCAYWPGEPPQPPAVIAAHPATRILVTNHLRDPATPVWGALAMRFALGPRARLLSVDGGGHGVYLLGGNACADAAATALLVRGVMPDADMLCAAEPGAADALVVLPADDGRAMALHELRRRLGPR